MQVEYDREVSTDLSEVLDMVNHAKAYGFDNITTMSFLAQLSGYVTNEEIEAYGETFLSEGMRERGYDEDDCKRAVERLTEWRDEYCSIYKSVADHE